MLLTYHTPLIYAFSSVSANSFRVNKNISSFISSYTIDDRHVHGAVDLVADDLSRVSTEDRPFEAMLATDGVKTDAVDYAEMVKQQATDVGVQRMFQIPALHYSWFIVC